MRRELYRRPLIAAHGDDALAIALANVRSLAMQAGIALGLMVIEAIETA